jgi:hypothetical protein
MKPIENNFEDFTDRCLEEMSELQEGFKELYDLSGYENWFYDHGTGVFHFKSGIDKNLYFKYVDVGSFSTNTNTWKWSWDNQSTPALVKRRIENVKEFGETNNFEQLTKGLIDGDEYTGWAMTAVTAKLLNAIGMYRIPHEHLFSYFVFTGELSQDEYDSYREKFVTCETHGTGSVAFVCRHLIENIGTGFHEAFVSDPLIDPEDDYQAWCDQCEIARLKAGGWNDISMAFADIKVVCEQCYFDIRERNKAN